MSIVVTGASGRLGRLVVKSLLDRVAASDLILVSRSPERLDPIGAHGAAVRYGDFAQPESLRAAFEGGSRALIISSMPPGDIVAQHRAAFEAAERAGLQHIAYTSFPNPVEGNPAPPAAYQRASEKSLRQIGVAWTLLRNALYSNLRTQIAPRYIAEGCWTTNMGAGGHAFVSRFDCANAAASVITETGHEGRTYEITGPELVGAKEYTQFLEKIAGHSIGCVDVDDRAFEDYRTAFEADPRNAAHAELYGGTGQAIRGGHLSQLTTAVRDITGREPLSVCQTFQLEGA